MPLTYTGPSEAEIAPLHEQYPGQFKTQPAFLELDPAKGTVRLGTNLVIGNGVPMDVWFHRVLWWDVPPTLTGRGCAEVFGELKPLLERVADGHELDWDGHNVVGKLSDDAREAYEAIEERLRDAQERFEVAEVWDAHDWLWGPHTLASLADALEVTADTTDDEIAVIVEAQREEAKRLNAVVVGDLAKEIVSVRERLRDLASEEALAP